MVTVRDKVWSTVFKLAWEDGEVNDLRGGFTVADILAESGLQPGQKRTVRRVLNAMVELGWLNHDTRSPVYRFEQYVPFDRSLHWTRDRKDERRLRKLSFGLGYPEGIPFWMILDCLESRMKEEYYREWKEKLEAEDKETSELPE